jgi:hypothetical protein
MVCTAPTATVGAAGDEQPQGHRAYTAPTAHATPTQGACQHSRERTCSAPVRGSLLCPVRARCKRTVWLSVSRRRAQGTRATAPLAAASYEGQRCCMLLSNASHPQLMTGTEPGNVSPVTPCGGWWVWPRNTATTLLEPTCARTTRGTSWAAQQHLNQAVKVPAHAGGDGSASTARVRSAL